MAVLITESVDTLTGTLEKTGAKRFRIKIIDEGVGSSGTYPAATLLLAAKEGIFAKGLHMYLDHPTAVESMDRPERTVKDLAAVLDGPAVYESGALYAPIKAYSAHAATIEEMKDDIGVSIRASAEVEAGPTGERIITRLVHAESVDFVTKAGRGGKVMEVLESAHARMVSEATASDIENWLERAVQAAHGGPGRGGYVYVRDHDAEYVYYRTYSEVDDKRILYREGYTLGDGDVTLAGDPIEVNAETVYKPVSPASPTPASEAPKDSPPNPAGVTENRKEPTVATTNIEESELSVLRADASRAAALEAENKTLRESAVKADAAKIVAEAFDGIDAPRTIARLAESYKLTESGQLDKAALTAEAEESAAEWKAAHGEGTVSGVGNTSGITESMTRTDDDIINALGGN
ncbi:hypothetical protein [Arthrobacter sp. G119Y2]|uniref:hypothetical protein n=1 Tax=Arthrobacter sp. G119Y2 TaxID=3134965 RepID=UPI003119175A